MNKNTNEAKVNAGQGPAKAEVIFLGLDVHAEQITVCRQIDGATPQPAQQMRWAEFLAWIKKQTALSKRVCSCYEAGPFGYGLHRQLCALGVENVVVAPQDWDERGTRVKTDGRDARALCARLERYVRGNRQAFGVVRVPTEEQERLRVMCRQRQSLLEQRQQTVARGTSLLLAHGHRTRGRWWKPRNWARFSATLPGWLRETLAPWQQSAVLLDGQELALRARIVALAPPGVPRGVGALTWVSLQSEVLDWARFKNRRQVGSYTGLCPSEHSSGGRRRQGAINRHGNPRLRRVLIECVWLLLRWQP